MALNYNYGSFQSNRRASWSYGWILNFPLGPQSHRSELRNSQTRGSRKSRLTSSLLTLVARRSLPTFPCFPSPLLIGTQPGVIPTQVRLFFRLEVTSLDSYGELAPQGLIQYNSSARPPSRWPTFQVPDHRSAGDPRHLHEVSACIPPSLRYWHRTHPSHVRIRN